MEAQIQDLSRRVAAAVRRSCPAWLAGQAEDISQQVMTRLLAMFRKSEGDRTFSTIYLEKAAHGTVVDEIRRRCRRRESSIEEDGVLDQAQSHQAGPERNARSTETGAGIRDCLRGLSRPRRLAVTLYLQGCSVPETAGAMQWPRKRAENLVYRGLAELRDCLRGKGIEP